MLASQKWGFDFVRGCPLEDPKLYLWERVPPTNEIPEMYTLSRAAHIRSIEADRTPSKKRRHTRRDSTSFLDLYDDMAEERNHYVAKKSNVLDLSFEDVDDGHTSASSCDEESFEEDNSLCDINCDCGFGKSCRASPAKISPVPLALSSSVKRPLATISTGIGTLRSANTAETPIAPAPSTSTVAQPSTIANPSCDTSSSTTTNTLNNNKSSQPSTSSSNPDSTRILRSSPRNREKRQFKITGKSMPFLCYCISDFDPKQLYVAVTV